MREQGFFLDVELGYLFCGYNTVHPVDITVIYSLIINITIIIIVILLLLLLLLLHLLLLSSSSSSYYYYYYYYYYMLDGNPRWKSIKL